METGRHRCNITDVDFDRSRESVMKPNIPDMPPIEGLHHWAIKCRDAEETRHFYEDILGLPLAHIIKADYVPSTKQHCPYVHLFFKMGDGSYVAFFDLGDDLAPDPSPNTPAWVNHMALRMNSVEEVEQAKARLEAHGVPVIGVTDHHFIKSIYFFDPNGYRMELTHELGPAAYIEKAANEAHAKLEAWKVEKAKIRAARQMKQAAE
jgi:glyoxylase I family protein